MLFSILSFQAVHGKLTRFFYILGATQVMAAVYGPVEVRANKELLDKASVEVIFRPKVGLPGDEEIAY